MNLCLFICRATIPLVDFAKDHPGKEQDLWVGLEQPGSDDAPAKQKKRHKALSLLLGQQPNKAPHLDKCRLHIKVSLWYLAVCLISQLRSCMQLCFFDLHII